LREYLNDIIVRSDPASPNDLKSKRKKTQNRSFLGVKNVKKQKSEDAIDAFLDDNSESENESYNKSSKSHLEMKTQRVMANFAAQGLQYGRSTLKTHSSSMVRLQNTEQHFAIDHEMDLISM
jgi:hypothetical protein